LPHWVELNFPEATVDVVEIDPGVTQVALAEFVPASRRITSHNRDARMALAHFPPSQTYDIIFGDVFNDLSVPYHLVTREFGTMVKDRLSKEGVYLVNVVDGREEGLFLGAIATTLEQVFPHVYTLPGMEWSESFAGRTPHIVVASLQPIPWAKWEQHESKPTFTVTPFQLTPTDDLLRPIFARRWRSQ
jgi:spermidine synthase